MTAETATEPLLDVRGVSREIQDRTIVDNIIFSFEAGRIYTIIGPSGAGKSSVLRLLNRLDEPTSGDILFHGVSTAELDPCGMRCKIGYLFQTPHMFPGSVRDNLLYAECSLQSDDIERLMEQVQIDPSMIDTDASSLSVGQQQRVALGRLLATNPEIALLDEPTSALDPSYTELIENTILSIIDCCDLTVVMVTHNPEQALRMGGHTLLMVAGQLVEDGSPEQLIRNPLSELGQLYRDKRLR